MKENAGNGFWNMYKKYSQDGMMFLNLFNLKIIFVGDLKTVKYLFNLPEVTGRMSPALLEMGLPIRKVKGPEMPGILLSEGDIWVQQRRFALRTLRDFGFGKQGVKKLNFGMFKTDLYLRGNPRLY